MDRFEGLGLVIVHKDDVLARIERDAREIGRRMAVATRAEVAEYAAVKDARFVEEVVEHAVEHVHAFVRSARAGRPPAGDELDFVRSRGALRARELLSLDALLEGYLIGQRTVWEAVVAAAGGSMAGMRVAQELTAATFRYTHAINVAVAAAYVRESQALASELERGRRELLDRLLSGRPVDSARAAALGLRADGEHFVVVADGGERVAAQALALDGVRSFVVEREGELGAVLPVYVRRGPSEARSLLAAASARLDRTHGVSMLCGISSVCAGLAAVPGGYAEAQRALGHASWPDAAAVAVEDVPLVDLLAAGADASVRRLVPAAARRLASEDSGMLFATLRAYADAGLNVARAAAGLGLHPNTVHYRLRRIADITELDPRRFDDLVELLLAERLMGR